MLLHLMLLDPIICCCDFKYRLIDFYCENTTLFFIFYLTFDFKHKPSGFPEF